MLRALVILLAFPGMAAAQQPSVDWLAPLIGVWNTTDTYQPLQGAPIVENAVRTCRAVMRNAYVECETVVERPNGTGRAYRFLINYNRNTSRFEMLSIWSNVPHKAVQSLTPNASRDRWVFENVAVVGDTESMTPHWSELVVESRDRIVWTGRRETAGSNPREAPISFLETWTRRAAAVH
jgi:hypothetical protein